MPPFPAPDGIGLKAPSADLDTYLELELSASAPYVDFVYGDPAVAVLVHARLLATGTGEFSTPFGKLAQDDEGRSVGMYAGPLNARQLAEARLRTALALRDDPNFVANPEIRTRAGQARAALLTLADGDAYLSRLAVAAHARGRGLGSRLLALFLDECRRVAAQRVVLEVSDEHAAAMKLYTRTGFTEVAVARARSADGRELSYRHLALRL
jgi:ribosomal protein S18 acetylase RimI-like enzyme